MALTNKIFLIGFMGSGKTTLGKKLAKKLNVPFFDLDLEIEKREELTTNEIFNLKGEDYFRKLEKEVLNNVIKEQTHFVMSVGGGTPCFFNNMDTINQSGTSIYLKYNAGLLTSRLINAKEKRPLIKGLDEMQLKEFVTNKLKDREVFYSQSKFILEKNNLKVEDLVTFF